MIFSSPDFDDHEGVHAFCDPRARLRGVIAVHSTALGPGFGGCRMWPYADEAAGFRDALRLSRGMSLKNAMADLPYGGGKAVIFGDPRSEKTPALFQAFGRAVERLSGRYITAEDVGVSVEDIQAAASETAHVGGIPQQGGYAGGDPSPWTALGVFAGMKAAASAAFGSDDLAGRRVAVQGLGAVGSHLCALLVEAGARLVVADLNKEALAHARKAYDAEIVEPSEILSAEADVLAPCALGGVLSAKTIPSLRAKVIAGAANNQLAHEADGHRLAERGILYAPDYVINAGGIISVTAERDPEATAESVRRAVEAIGPRTVEILDNAAQHARTPGEVADHMALAKIGR